MFSKCLIWRRIAKNSTARHKRKCLNSCRGEWLNVLIVLGIYLSRIYLLGKMLILFDALNVPALHGKTWHNVFRAVPQPIANPSLQFNPLFRSWSRSRSQCAVNRSWCDFIHFSYTSGNLTFLFFNFSLLSTLHFLHFTRN